MRTVWVLIATVVVGCAAGPERMGPDPGDPGDVGEAASAVPQVRCDGAPQTAGPVGFHHVGSGVIAALGDPKHRGLDLVASTSAASQQIEGAISYTFVDKALEDEDVELFACDAGRWRQIAAVRTDDEGRFALALTGADRLEIGMRDMFASVVGDRTGARFLAYVAPEGVPLVVSDVDGTLTSSENAFLETVAGGEEPGVRASAPAVFTAAAARGRQLVYVTSRGSQYTGATRDWLDRNHFPRGPLRLAPSFLTLPGSNTVDYKTKTIQALTGAGFSLAAGVGNRASDVSAYQNAGLAPDRIFIELPEFQDELQPMLDVHAAVGFSRYDELADRL